MKKHLVPYLLCSILFTSSCGNESDAPLGDFETFVRYFGTADSNEIAVQVNELPDGNIVMLSNTEIPTNEIGRFRYKATLTLTNPFGHRTWDIRYPNFGDNGNFRGNSFIVLPNGNFIVVGENISSNNQSNLMLVEISGTGSFVNAQNFDRPVFLDAQASVKGYGITLSSSGLLVLSSISNNGTNQENMLLQLVNVNTLETEWIYGYGSDPGTLTKRLFVNSGNAVLWAGTKINNNQSDFRLIAAPKNSQSPVFDLPIGLPDKNEESHDISQYANGFVLIGSTNNTADGTTNVLLVRTTENGNVIFENNFGREQNDVGKSVTSARDGSILVFANSETATLNNYYLVRLDSFGNIIWERLIGSNHNEDAVGVVEASDGGIILCGTTDFGGRKKAMLMKVNKEGNLF